MRAELISVGSELLLGGITDTNAQFLAGQLASLGIDLYHKQTVGDNWTRLLTSLGRALERADLIILSGGLGPTDDDLTRPALATLLGLEFREDEPTLEAMTQRLRTVSEKNRRQAQIPMGGEALPNHWGTAPGIWLEWGGRIFLALPGPPHELQGIFHNSARPRLAQRTGAVIHSHTLRLVGIGESSLVEVIDPILVSQTNPTIAPLASGGEVHLRLTAKAKDVGQAQAIITQVVEELTPLIRPWLYGRDEETLESVVGQMLRERGLQLAVAESCTGGGLGERLTRVGGSSDYFLGGVISYANEVKSQVLGVSEDLLQAHGAVSPQVAMAMAQGVRQVLRADIGMSITGIAGPGGGSLAKPTGLVYLGLSHKRGEDYQEYQFPGDRDEVRRRSVTMALYLLWKLMGDSFSA